MKYKKILIQDHLLTDIEKSLMENFNNDKLFQGIKFQIEDNNLVVCLNSIDLNNFKIALNNILNQHNLKLSDTVFSDVLFKIEAIGSYGIKNGKRIFVDYNKERKVLNRQEKVQKRILHYYTQNHNFESYENKIPDQYINTIICSDSEKLLAKLPDNSVDLIFTSPPYNFGLGYDKTEDGIDWNEYFKKLFLIFDECIRVLKYGGRIIVNVQPLFSDYIPIHHKISNFFMEKKLIWRGEILWEKNNYNCKYTAWGSWKSPSNPYLKYTWEFLEIFCKGDLKKIGTKENADIDAEEFKKWVVAKWSIPPEKKMKDFDHPAMFPEELVRRVLRLFSFKGDIVLDPFNGAGTTTLVSKKLGRKFIGIDESDKYCEIAKKRLKEVPLIIL